MDIKKAATATLKLVVDTEFDGKANFPLEGPLSFEHVCYMCDEMIMGRVEGEKAHRWLGWAQCAAVSAGAGELSDMKFINHES